MMKPSYVVEFIGTFILTLVAGLSGSALAIGGVLAALIFAGGPISGGHFNPAVTFGMWLRKQISQTEAGIYFLAQLLGAVVAAMMVYLLKDGQYFLPSYATDTSWATAALAEGIFTFAFVLVILHVATHETAKNNQYFGLAIGFTLMAAILSIGAISGGVLNPAIGIATQLVDYQHLSQHADEILLYLVGPLSGATVAATAYGWMYAKKK